MKITEDNPIGEYLDWVKENYPSYYDLVDKTFHEDMQHPPIPMAETGMFKAVYTSPVPEYVHQAATPRSGPPGPRANPSYNGCTQHEDILRYPDETGGYILTNIEDDPLEYTNLIGNPDYGEIETELKNELHDWLLRTPHYFPVKEYLW